MLKYAPSGRAALGKRCVVIEDFADPKVRHFHAPVIIDQEVVRLQVKINQTKQDYQ